MKRILLVLLFIPCLLACRGEDSTKAIDSVDSEQKASSTAIPVTVADAATPEPMIPLHMVVDRDNVPDLGIEMEVTDGERYGCDLICWFDGFGYCYNLENAENNVYEIRLSPKLSAIEVFSAGYSQQEAYIDSGYGVYLTSETETYRIGFLRILNKPHVWGYGTYFELWVEYDPQVDLFPVEPQWEKPQDDAAAWFEIGQDEGHLLMHPTRYKAGDTGYEEVDGARGEPCLVEITEETLITICFFDSEQPDMVLSRDRLLQLVRDGYFMEYPCWVYVSDGKLISAVQIMYE